MEPRLNRSATVTECVSDGMRSESACHRPSSVLRLITTTRVERWRRRNLRRQWRSYRSWRRSFNWRLRLPVTPRPKSSTKNWLQRTKNTWTAVATERIGLLHLATGVPLSPLRRSLFMQVTLFYTANCLYIIFFIFLWSPYVIGRPYIFSSCFFLLSFFSSPNLSGRRLDVYHTLAHGVALVRI